MKLVEDRLSAVLLGAALIFGALYLLEQEGLKTLDQSEVRAQSIDLRGLDDASCEAHAAGFGGRILVVKCAGEDRVEGYAESLEDAARHAGFEALDVRTASGRLKCQFEDGSSVRCESKAARPE